jgi:hypothetical protein
LGPVAEVGAWTAVFPFAVLLLAIGVALLALRLDRRLGRGAHSAGPLETERPKPVGLEQTPWELRGIDRQLAQAGRGAPAVPRYDLTATVNRLLAAAGLDDPRDELPITADRAELERAITMIEDQLGLPPLTGGS